MWLLNYEKPSINNPLFFIKYNDVYKKIKYVIINNGNNILKICNDNIILYIKLYFLNYLSWYFNGNI